MNINNKKAQIVCVFNKPDIFEKCIASNTYANKYKINKYDNTKSNESISKRYNSFIKKYINRDSDFWAILIHQDFSFDEDPYKVLKNLNKDHIYGPIGVVQKKQFLSIINFKPKFNVTKTNLIGQIRQFKKNKNTFKQKGLRISNPTEVETLDCCCLILHSSLIYKYKLRFDENLEFHLYSEDFSITAKNKYGIKTKAISILCTHFGEGNINKEFLKNWEYLLKKHKLKKITSTCAPKKQ